MMHPLNEIAAVLLRNRRAKCTTASSVLRSVHAPRDQGMLFPEFCHEAHCKFASYQDYQFEPTTVCAKGLLAALVKV